MRVSANALVAAMLIATPVIAEDWTPMTGDQIKAELVGPRWDYGGAWQEFMASGRTLYNAGEDSWGYWEVRGDMYCSTWPPAGGWACYSMQRSNSGMIRFIGESGDVTEGSKVSD